MFESFLSRLAQLLDWLARPDVLGSKKRSGRWPAVRKAFLARNPRCAACGTTDSVVPHHIVPFHLEPGLELEESNLISLCEQGGNCHLVFGHFKDWRAYNPDVRADAQAYALKRAGRRYDPE